MYFFYNLVIYLFFILAFPYFLVRSIFTSRYRSGLKEKLGFISKAKKKFLDGQERKIWLHAVSVGETLASLPLIELLKEKLPDYHLIISTTTSTGQEIAKKRVSKATFIYFPLDLFWIVSKVLNIIKPNVFVVAESEIWPNFYKVAYERNIPIILFNGRISLSSYKQYRKVGVFFRKVLSFISSFGMQTELDAQRIISLGGDSSRVKVTGNTKFDALIELSPQDVEQLKNELRFSSQDLVLVAGSTHQREEEIILRCFLKLKREFTNLNLILCPRHLERLTEIESILNRFRISFSRRTNLTKNKVQKAFSVLLLDTIGELAKVYSLASVVYVGGSLIPKGGQNILEPINFGKPTIFGPYISNFQEIAELLENSKIGFQIKNETELYQKIFFLLKDEHLRESIKNKARLIIEHHRGASLRNFELIKRYLN